MLYMEKIHYAMKQKYCDQMHTKHICVHNKLQLKQIFVCVFEIIQSIS